MSSARAASASHSSRWNFNHYARVVAVVLLVLMGGAIVAATAYLLKDCLYELGTQETMQERGGDVKGVHFTPETM